jgi:cellulose synthase/poly-beta-1,6-N-acetylglucosamine synthase-like glycosyltransferase
MNSHTALLILLTLGIVSLVDYIPRLILLSKKHNQVLPGYGRVPRYLIMPTVYGDIAYLKNLSFLKKYSHNVVICTSKYESEQFYADLRRVCRQYGLRYICADVPKVKGVPVRNAYTIYKGAFRNLNRLGVAKDTPCILIDADTYATKNVNNLVRAFKALNVDIASLRCEVDNPTSLLEKLQAYEYRMAMDNRRMDPWLTSGACNMAKASVFKAVFSRHSDFFAGGDIEIGKLAQVMGYKVAHLNFSFYTEVPSTVRDWFNQRIVWFAGGVRHHVANIGSFGWHHFFIFFYNSLIVYLLLPLRWIEVSNFPLTLAALVILSWLYSFILTAGRGWQPAYLMLPVYGFTQSMIILPIAAGRYVKYAWRQRSLGLLNYDLSRYTMSMRLLFKALNVTTAAIVLYAAVAFTELRFNYWYANGHLLKHIFAIFN